MSLTYHMNRRNSVPQEPVELDAGTTEFLAVAKPPGYSVEKIADKEI